MLLALVRRAELVALEVLELGTGRKLSAVIRHNDPILFRRLPRLGSARATHMRGVDRPVGARGFGDPLNRAARLRRLVPFCRHDKGGLAVAAEVRARRPRSPEPFRHGKVANRVGERGARNERRSESDDGAHDVARAVSNSQLYRRRHAMFQPGMPVAGAPVSARQRLRSIAARYNCSIPAFSRTPFHFAISPAIWALSSSGVELRASAPKLRTCLAMLSRPSNSCIALFILCTTAGAVPAGKASPYQLVTSKPGMPASVKVGTSERMGLRFGE